MLLGHLHKTVACPIRCCGCSLHGPPAEPLGNDLIARTMALVETSKNPSSVSSMGAGGGMHVSGWGDGIGIITKISQDIS